MAVTNTTLFPPILKDTQPAFINTGSCRIYFNLSQFNSLDEIRHAQITVINQKNNKNVLNSSYPDGIKIINEFNQSGNNDYKYYVEISSSDIVGGAFELNQFYKVQIRFSNIDISSPTAQAINSNLDHFSEWSTVSLIKGISIPTISINTLDQSTITQFSIPPTIFSGKLTFSNSAEKETLKSFSIKIYKNGENKPFINSGINYTNQYNPNQFTYDLLYDFEKQILYTLEFSYTTINNYSNTVNFNFKIKKEIKNELNAILNITPEQSQGRMKINVAFKPLFSSIYDLVIQRTSSKTNFLKWKNMKQLEHNSSAEKHYFNMPLTFGTSTKIILAEWTKGSILQGDNYDELPAADCRLRTVNYIDNISNIQTTEGYDCMIFAYDKINNEYVGRMTTNGTFSKSGTIKWVSSFNLSNYQYNFRFVLRVTNAPEVPMDISQKSNISFTASDTSPEGYYTKSKIFVNASNFKKVSIDVNQNQLYLLTSKDSSSGLQMARAFFINQDNEIIGNPIQNDEISNGQLRKQTQIIVPENAKKMIIQTRAQDMSQVVLLKLIEENPIDSQYLWYDTTIESGIWYKYRIQQVAENGKVSVAQQPVMCVFEDIFLTNNDRQLKIQFNPTVSDFKYNVNESQQITLGSQFPYIRRNGNNYYRSFSIGGLVSALTDQQNWYDPNYNQDHGYFYNKNVAEPFTTPEQLYKDAATALYENYNDINDITQYKDYIYERQFRQKVMEFLYQNSVKLFRSLTEGNILIKLNNITFAPVDTLGRMLYSFSATATEVDENNIDNLRNYNLINKYYYTYSTLLINGNFKCGRSLIDKFYNQLPLLDTKTTDIMQLTFSRCRENAEDENYIDAVIYAKPINNKNLYRYVTQNGTLILSYSDADPIAESYFYGIHIPNMETSNEYYNSISEITNPQNGTIYYILKDEAYLINNYIKYYNEIDLLQTYRHQVVQNLNNDYALLVELDYYKIVYYNGHWYPYTSNGDIIIDNLYASVEYTYRVKKEGQSYGV